MWPRLGEASAAVSRVMGGQGRREGKEGRSGKLFLKEALKCEIISPSPQLKRLKMQNLSALAGKAHDRSHPAGGWGFSGHRELQRSQQSPALGSCLAGARGGRATWIQAWPAPREPVGSVPQGLLVQSKPPPSILL